MSPPGLRPVVFTLRNDDARSPAVLADARVRLR